MTNSSMRVARVLAVSLILVLGTTVANAQDNKEGAKIHFQNGTSMMELEDFAGAAVEFEASISQYPTKNAMFNLGMCYKALHRYPQALDAFRNVLKTFGAKLGDEMRGEVRKNIAAINKMIAELEISTNLPGATIIIDGQKVGVTPLEAPVALGAGEHRIRASLQGYRDIEEVVVVAAQSKEVVSLQLIPLSTDGGGGAVAAPIGAKGSITVPPGITAPSRPVFNDGYKPPEGSIDPPSAPLGPGKAPKEGDRSAKIYGIGVGLQGVAGLIGIAAYYGSGSDAYLNNVGVWYFLATAAGGGLLTWAYGNGSHYYDVPIWAMYIGSVVGAGLGYLFDYLIWNQGMERTIPDIDRPPELMFGALGMAIVSLAVAPAGPAVAYAIFKKPEARFRQKEDKKKPAVETTPPPAPVASISFTPPSIFPMRIMDGTGRTALGIHLIGGSF